MDDSQSGIEFLSTCREHREYKFVSVLDVIHFDFCREQEKEIRSRTQTFRYRYIRIVLNRQ